MSKRKHNKFRPGDDFGQNHKGAAETTIRIKGMHCHSCELLIEESLKEIEGVESIQVDYKRKQAIVYSTKPIEDDIFRSKIEEAGYEVGVEDKKHWINLNPEAWRDIAIAAIILTTLFFAAKWFGLFNLKIGGGSGAPSSLAVVLLVGLTAGFSTCMAMVGGLILGISARFSEHHPEATPVQKFRPHLFFNLGRIASYLLLGGLIGLIGKAFQLSGTVLGTLLILVGIVMIILGAQLTELFPRLASISFSLPAGIGKFFGIHKIHEKEYSHKNALISGALTFFLPCGFTQAMQLYAMSSGNFWSGALIMGTFALGTAPGLLGVGGLTSVIKGIFARRFFKGAGILVIALAIFNISNGMNLAGFSTKLANAFQSNNQKTVLQADKNVTFTDGVQEVRMTQNASGYSPNSFTVKKGVPVKWIITSTDSSTCAASLYSQQLNIRKLLQQGENIIEFTPTETGKIPFSCSMGMYRGSFNVVDTGQGIPSSSSNDIIKPSTTPATPSTDSSAPSASSSPNTASNLQIIQASYTLKGDLSPKQFNIKANQPTKFEIDPKDDGQGCMSSITIPDLIDNYEIMEKGKLITFNFTAKPGKYTITCAMGVPRGTIIAE